MTFPSPAVRNVSLLVTASPSQPKRKSLSAEMSRLLRRASQLSSISRRSVNSILAKSRSPILSPSSFTCRHRFLLSLHSPISALHSLLLLPYLSIRTPYSTSADAKHKEEEEKKKSVEEKASGSGGGGVNETDYLSGEFEFRKFSTWEKFLVKLRMMLALPWERVPNGSVFTMKLRGKISDQLKSPISPRLSLPQICENLIKAAYDPRISGIYLHIENLKCGWGKLDEIQRHILNFKKSGKFVLGFVPACGEKEYYLASACDELYFPPSAYISLYGLASQAFFLGGVFEKLGIEPQVQQIGKYKGAGDLLSRKTMTNENHETLTKLVDQIYWNWVDKVSSSKGKRREDIEKLIDEGVCQVERLKEEGWITDIQYEDEIISMLKERLGVQKEKDLPVVDYGRYSRVRKWTVGLTGGKDLIAVIRASGLVSRVRSPLASSGIIAEQLIKKIRAVRESNRFKAAIVRIDSPGGDALASDLEIRLLAASKPVIASMSDVAASGGYYVAMGAGTVVAENLTLTGSIGVVTAKFNLRSLYEKIGINKEIISRGKYAELNAAEHRPLRSDEAEIFAKFAQNIYKQFVEKAAFSRSMTVDKMEEVAQGRVWTGKDAASIGLVDAIGGLSRATAIAKQKANIPQDRPVTLVELSKPSPTLAEFITLIGGTQVGVDQTLEEIVGGVTLSDGVQARMDGIMFQNFDEASYANPTLQLIKDYLNSL